MSDRIGLASLEGSRAPLFLPVPARFPKEYSEETPRAVDEEVKKILSEAHAKVTAIVSPRRQVLDELAQLLLQKEVIDRLQLQAVLNASRLDHAA
jgi:cell division protease FtsH